MSIIIVRRPVTMSKILFGYFFRSFFATPITFLGESAITTLYLNALLITDSNT